MEISQSFLHHLNQNHEEDAVKVLEQEDPDRHYSVEFLFTRLPAEIGEALLREPLQTLEILDETLMVFVRQVCEQRGGNLQLKRFVNARVFGLPEHSGHILSTFPEASRRARFNAVSGIVVKVSERKLIERSKFYRCTKCKKTTVAKALPSRGYEFPPVVDCEDGCTEGNVIPLTHTELTESMRYSVQRDYQQIRIQENGGQGIPNTMTVDLDNDLVDRVLPGYNLCITGTTMLRILQHRKNKKILAETFMIANHIEVINDRQTVSTVTPQSLDFFRRFWDTPNPYGAKNEILKSFAPHIFGMRWVKESLMIVFAGIPTSASDGERTRSNPHILLAGDSGVGKTKLLKYASSLIPGSISGSGSGSSEAGLSVAAVRSSTGWSMEPGLLPLACYSLAIVDEVNLMKDSDKQILHESMEQQSISFSKAGMNATLKTKCSLIGACNPKFDHFDVNKDLSLNIGLSGPLTSRFDIIVMLVDERNVQWDTSLADHILDILPSENHTSLWSHEQLKEYFAHVKTVQATTNSVAVDILGKYYKLQRGVPGRDITRTTPRLFDTLIRLAICHARLMLRNTVNTHDCVIAIKLVDQSFGKNAVCDYENVVQSLIPVDPIADYYHLAEKILNAIGCESTWLEEKLKLENLGENLLFFEN